jgi:transposase
VRTSVEARELLPRVLRIESLSIEAGRVSISVSSAAEECVCPVCWSHSSRAHSRYRRNVSDLPWHGVSVELRVRAGRFFCAEASCERKIFCESLPDIAARVRKSSRLEEALLAIAIELGGRAGARLALKLSIVAARDALLRRSRPRPCRGSGRSEC